MRNPFKHYEKLNLPENTEAEHHKINKKLDELASKVDDNSQRLRRIETELGIYRPSIRSDS